MTTLTEQFGALHKPGDPLVLYNIWDAASARAVAEAGAKAIATGSWSVAGAQGFTDGQKIPLDLVLTLAARITASVDLPVTLDLEGGYAEAPDEVAANVAKVAATGIVGINFEDQVVGGEGLYDPATQSARIAAIRAAVPGLFINARTDLFLKEKDASQHAALVDQALERAAAYAAAGASGFFVPGLTDPDLFTRICADASLPVNVMTPMGQPTRAELAPLGVARISFGPGPYRTAMAELTERAKAHLQAG